MGVQEAIKVLAEYDRMSDDAPASHRAAIKVNEAITALAQGTGVPVWFLIGWSMSGVEVVEDFQAAWKEWQSYRHLVPELEEDSVPF